MNISITARKYNLKPETAQILEEILSAPFRLLGADSEGALLEIEVEEAPAEGRSSEPCRVIARLIVHDDVFHAEAVKPTPQTAADRVRDELEASIRRSRGKTRRMMRRGGGILKRMLRFGGRK